jgi:hypothetical protein
LEQFDRSHELHLIQILIDRTLPHDVSRVLAKTGQGHVRAEGPESFLSERCHQGRPEGRDLIGRPAVDPQRVGSSGLGAVTDMLKSQGERRKTAAGVAEPFDSLTD